MNERSQVGIQIVSRDKTRAKTFFFDSNSDKMAIIKETQPAVIIKGNTLRHNCLYILTVNLLFLDDNFEEMFVHYLENRSSKKPRLQVIVFLIGFKHHQVPSHDGSDCLKSLIMERNKICKQINDKLKVTPTIEKPSAIPERPLTTCIPDSCCVPGNIKKSPY